jgi:hypothetical protein
LANNNLVGQVPKEIAFMKELKLIDLGYNNMTGAVPALPFKQYTRGCTLVAQKTHTNHFKCPLPANQNECLELDGDQGLKCDH